ncbi:MAG: hypothetical protein JXB10_18610 [Pirellulales bacterium]|nr:hypothetical protein [Pirellulales bacterium]
MSERERWIVYPLLFLALGVALRNQFFPTKRFGAIDLRAGELSAQRIRCNELVVEGKTKSQEIRFDKAGGNMLKCGRIDGMLMECHALNVVSGKGKSLVMAGEDSKTHSGVFQVLNARGIPLLQVPLQIKRVPAPSNPRAPSEKRAEKKKNGKNQDDK